jgi:anti-sigma28 factor (negative regulator of flagellin synthesis)
VREARVADLRDRIARGDYAVDAERVAEAMLRDEAVVRLLS